MHLDYQELTLSINSKFENTALAAMAIRGICSLTELNHISINRIELCLVEVINNAIEHAYQKKPSQKIEIYIKLTKEFIEITISDWGAKMPDSFLENTTELNNLPQVWMKDGRGLFIVQSLMNDVCYQSENGKNSFIFKKKF